MSHEASSSEASAPQPSDGPPPAPRLSLIARLRAYFFAGILVTAPISITVYLAWNFIAFVDQQVTPLIPVRYLPDKWSVPGLGLLIVIVAVTVIGMFAAGYMGRTLVKLSESLLARMPVVRGVYGALKQIFETVLAQKSTAFREVVMFEYPRRGIWCLGFITGRTEGEVQNVTSEEVVNVFLPTTPNPTSGFLLFVPKRDVYVLEMTVEEGIKMVMSGGIITPPDRRPDEAKAVPVVSVTEPEIEELTPTARS